MAIDDQNATDDLAAVEQIRDARIQIGHCDSDMVHYVGGGRWLSGKGHGETSRLKDVCCGSET